MATTQESKHYKVIEPSSGWKMVDFQELWRYKDLLYFLTLRGIKARYAQSILGVSWAIIQPLFTTLVFTLVFGGLAKVDSDGMPYLLFSYLALWPWNYFSGTLTESANSLIQNANMITKVYFPRMVLPLSAILSKLLDFIIAFVVVIGLLIYFKQMPGWGIVFLPLLIIQLLMCSLGIGMFLSALAVKYRDVKHALTFLVQLLLYAAPVVYSTQAVPEKYLNIYILNPMVGVIEGFRAAFLNRPMPWDWIWPGSIVAVIFFVFGMLYFRRMERIFADVA
ncbi:lipopolysaccharide transport system permease protein [Algoriphagus zhangzhouensis]|uniref:Transport permease protein n=2 Tax=Algoriphagus zhangzhouensis TaxID=1073327 RepID=A0A1M7ZI75_9BACT|nr:lipopolysaccharide transport system permease protein [Algoriphagus zhangzhouensis]SHO64588.1 lipopolysaccharide transport system permease protein [Algoriphagus zhangzhouensis]